MTEAEGGAAPPADEVLDCVGLFCPNPIIQTSQRLKELGPVQTLEVIADDPTFPKDIPDWCGKTGHEFLGIRIVDGEFRALIRKP